VHSSVEPPGPTGPRGEGREAAHLSPLADASYAPRPESVRTNDKQMAEARAESVLPCDDKEC
jgi:hypothetical protein